VKRYHFTVRADKGELIECHVVSNTAPALGDEFVALCKPAVVVAARRRRGAGGERPRGATMTALAKPPHGAPCNNCGQCCLDSVCPLGAHLFGRTVGPCPALRPDRKCDVVCDPKRYAPRSTLLVSAKDLADDAAVLIGAGAGCDALLAGEARDLAFSRRLRSMAGGARAAAAKRRWVGA
jgi:hypothetical protein